MRFDHLVTIALCLVITGCVGEVSDLDPSDQDSSSQGSGSGEPPPPAMTVTEYLNQLGSKQCTAAFACQATYPTTEPVTFESLYGTSPTTCSPTIVASYDPATIESEVAAGNIYFNGGAAKSCLAALTAGDCSTFWTNGGISLSSCRDVFHGTVSDGEACVHDLDCVNWDSVCDPANSTCTATDADE